MRKNSNEKRKKDTSEEAPAFSTKSLDPLPIIGTLAWAFRHIGGIETALSYIRLASHKDERLAVLSRRWDELSPSERQTFSLERLCAEVGISPEDLLGRIVSAAYHYNRDVSHLIAAIHQPDVLETMARLAQTPGYIKDRELFLTGTGFIPTKTGPSINISNQLVRPPTIEAIIKSTSVKALPADSTEYINAEPLMSIEADLVDQQRSSDLLEINTCHEQLPVNQQISPDVLQTQRRDLTE